MGNYDEVEFTFVPGARKNSLVLYLPEEQQLYHKNTTGKCYQAYVCQVPQCSIRAYMLSNGKCMRLKNTAHMHRPQEDHKYRNFVVNLMKKEVFENPNLTVRQCFDIVLARCGISHG